MATIFVTSPRYLDDLLYEELSSLGATALKRRPAGVEVQGSVALAYRICLESRLANRVLWHLWNVPAPDARTLYANTRDFPWEEHLDPNRTFAVQVTGSSPGFRDPRAAALSLKDAIVDRLRDREGFRPSVDRERPDLPVNLHLSGGEASLSLDLSGESLHQRGYRTSHGPAPLKENVAAALLLRAGWPQLFAAGGCLLDPMCGAGTLVIEAALLASDTAVGLFRPTFAFENWRGHEASAHRALLKELRERAEVGQQRLPSLALRGSDRDRRSVGQAQENARRAQLGDKLVFNAVDFTQTKPHGERGLVITNAPYGERLGSPENLAATYAALGRHLRENFGGWEAAVLVPQGQGRASPQELSPKLQLGPVRPAQIMNGNIPCVLLRSTLPKGPETPKGAAPATSAFGNRLRKNQKKLGAWAKQRGVTCYRLYDADIPEYAVAVDLYEDHVHVQEYAPGRDIDPRAAQDRRQEILEVLPAVLDVPPQRVIFKQRRPQKGKNQYEKLGASGHMLEVREGGHRFWVNLHDYLDTGLFLDHRLTREHLRTLARGRRFLNLFAYTGSATVYAAAGGARSTLSVDMSNTYTRWCEKNLELNGYAHPRHRVLRDDVLRFIEEHGDEYGLIFLDPPTFSNSKFMSRPFDLQNDHVALISKVAERLEPTGVLVFSNNFRKFKFDEAGLSHLTCKEITQATIPKDFERNPRIHRCWEITLKR